MADFGKYSSQYTLRRKKLGEGEGGGGGCRMSIMAFELPIMEMDFALSEF